MGEGRAEWAIFGEGANPDLKTPAIVPAHPAAVALALLLLRVKKVGAVVSAWATVLEPATEHGRAAMDELHQQTISLLSFQSTPKETYDAQVAFNLLPVLGEEAKVNLGATEARIRRHLACCFRVDDCRKSVRNSSMLRSFMDMEFRWAWSWSSLLRLKIWKRR